MIFQVTLEALPSMWLWWQLNWWTKLGFYVTTIIILHYIYKLCSTSGSLNQFASNYFKILLCVLLPMYYRWERNQRKCQNAWRCTASLDLTRSCIQIPWVLVLSFHEKITCLFMPLLFSYRYFVSLKAYASIQPSFYLNNSLPSVLSYVWMLFRWRGKNCDI